jgi:hypothetical protein
MIDPVTAVMAATNAFNMVKKMVAAGREIDDTLGQIGAWYGAVSDFNEAKKQAENPPLFRRLVSAQSVEQEAMNVYIQNKKIAFQENELRVLLMYTYGQTGYTELVQLRRKIKEQREATIYAQARRRKAFVWNTLTISAIGTIGYFIYYIFKLIINQASA